MIVQELFATIGIKVNNSSFENAQKRIQGLQNNLSGMNKYLKGLGGLLGGLTVGALFKGLVDASTELQTVETRLKNIDPSLKLKDMVSAANSAGISTEAFTDRFVKLKDAMAGTTTSDVLELMDNVHTAFNLAGATAEEARDYWKDLTNTLSKGTADIDILIKTSQRAPEVFNRLTKSILGKNGTASALFELSKTGKLSSKELQKNLTNVSKQMSKDGVSAATTYGDAWNSLTNNIRYAFYHFEKATGLVAKTTSAIIMLGNGIRQLTDWIKDHSTELKITAGLLAIVFLPAILAATKAILALAGAAAAAAAPFLPVIALVSALFLLVNDFVTWIQGGDSIFGYLFGDYQTIVTQVTDVIETVINSIKQAYDWVTGLGKRLRETLESSGFTRLAKFLEEGGTAINDAGRWISGQATKAYDWVSGNTNNQTVTINQTNNITSTAPETVAKTINAGTLQTIKRAGVIDKAER